MCFVRGKKWGLSKLDLVYDSENVVHVSLVLRPNTNSLYSIMLILDIQKNSQRLTVYNRNISFKLF